MKAKLLVVDDEARNRALMEALLAPLGYEVVTAEDGQEALEKARESSPDVILMDIMMPRLNGFEATRRLKQDRETGGIPVVMVTALKEVEDRVKALEAGADDFLSKPIDRTELRARVGSLLKVKAYNDHMRDYQKELESEVARKTEQLREALESLKTTSLDTIRRLSLAAEYKDEDTGAHIHRMSHYTAALARELGMSEETVEGFLFAAPMHDIGKIGIPDRVLLKPGKLDGDEWRTMQRHTRIGARILRESGSKVVRLAEGIALCHHERWDGSGYPEGLKGPAIPMAARVVAVADVFDALTSRRPYRREPFSAERASAMLGEGRGSHFDPEVLDAFFSAKAEVLAAKEACQDEGESLLAHMTGLE